MNRILCILAAGSLFAGCASTSTNTSGGGSHRNTAKARAGQVREGMTRGQVESILGAPNKVDHDDGYHHGHGYIPYYGWHHRGSSEPEIKWEYKHPDIEITFRKNHRDVWVVNEIDR